MRDLVLENDVRHGFAGAVGNTPLIRLEGPSEATGCDILGKATPKPGGMNARPAGPGSTPTS